jgi:hypothetical protein
MTEGTVFLAAVDSADPARRTAYPAEVCGDGTTLRGWVASLLGTQ